VAHCLFLGPDEPDIIIILTVLTAYQIIILWRTQSILALIPVCYHEIDDEVRLTFLPVFRLIVILFIFRGASDSAPRHHYSSLEYTGFVWQRAPIIIFKSYLSTSIIMLACQRLIYLLQAFAANYIETNGGDGRPRRLIVDDFGMCLFSVPYTLH